MGDIAHIGGEKDMLSTLQGLVGDEVILAVSSLGLVRDGFHSQISLRGFLEQHSKSSEAFRIMLDGDSYAYFKAADVYIVNPLARSCPTIHASIDTAPMQEWPGFEEVAGAVEEGIKALEKRKAEEGGDS